MTSVCQIAPYFVPVLFWVQPGFAAPTSSYAEHYLGDGCASSYRGASIARADSQSEISARPRVAPVHASVWLQDVGLKIDRYASLADGWKGPGSHAPTPEARNQAFELAGQFAFEIPEISAPVIGADDDGAITLHWSTPEMSATVTAHGDSTFSFYAENSEASGRSDSEMIGAPLPRLLIRIMASDAALGTIAA
jgi:hypothetical protein